MLLRIVLIFGLCLSAFGLAAFGAETGGIRIMEVQPPAEISRDGGRNWDAATTKSDTLKPGHRVRTGDKGRMVLLLNDKTIKRMGESSAFIVQPEGASAPTRFLRGIGYFFNRDKPGETQVEGPLVGAVVKGTEFVFEVDENGVTRVTVLEGEVSLTNALGEATISAGRVGTAGTNTAPELLPVLISDVPGQIQWALYYPGVLDLNELPFTAGERKQFEPAMAAYNAGDLRGARRLLPDAGELQSPATKLLSIALDLLGGRAAQVRKALDEFEEFDELRPQLRALRWLMDAVQFKARIEELPPVEQFSTASEKLAQSYARQSARDLEGALEAAKYATRLSPNFGYAWARVAELEFSFGRARESAEALEMARGLSPRNAQASALEGFVFAAQNKTTRAHEAFEKAIELDGALANGWLGRGLLRIRSGDKRGGQEDLLMAAALEPQRAFLRSYLGKALDIVDSPKARHELELAKQLDPADPTPFLYAALLDQNSNRINSAVRELEASRERVENRGVYRSEFLLDEDRAVRSAHLASIYRDAGMQQQSRHEAASSLASDYANPSAHLFLAESYLSLDRVNLRYEGARVSEYLIANLLAPAGAAAWSPGLSQQEYSALFERDGAGLVSSTEYRSNGRWTQTAAGYGNWRGANATIDGLYHSDPGFRANNDLQISSVSLQYKQQITPEDTFYLQPLWSSAESGDLVEYYSDAFANPGVRVREKQEPIVLSGWRHDWAPGHKTVFLAAYLNNNLDIDNPNSMLPRLDQPFIGDPIGYSVGFDERYRSQFEAGSAELQQILQTRIGDTVFGGLAQIGKLEVTDSLRQVSADFPTIPTRLDRFESDTERFAAYAYQSWRPHERFELIGGLSYDHMQFPGNFRLAPLRDSEKTKDQLSPKAGISAQLWEGSTLRGAYAQSLGGIGFDQSFRIEPSQVAGINQRFRSLIPEAIAGSNAGEEMEMAGADFSQKFGSNTWLNISAVWLTSEVGREAGAFRGAFPNPLPGFVSEQLNYRERNLQLTINRLIGRDVALGASYSIGEAVFEQSAAGVFPRAAQGASLATSQKSILQQGTLFGVINHPSGVFFRAEGIWTHQDNRRDVSGLAGDDFWHGNLYAGWRFAKRRAEVSAGLLNFSDARYQLHPLNLRPALSRERTFFLALKWSL